MYILQLIALAIYFIVMYSATRNFKNTILMWVPLSMMFNPQVCVWYNPPITSLTVATNISLCTYYFLIVRGHYTKYGLRKGSFFFNKAIGFMLASYIVSTIISEIPFSISFNKTVKTFLEQYGIVILFFRCINTFEDIKLFLKSVFLCGLIVTINGIIEFIVHINPIADFIFYTSPCNETTLHRGWHYPYSIGGINARFGLIRCYSSFALHLLFGYACCLMFFVIQFFSIRGFYPLKLSDKHGKKLSNFILILLVIGIIICNSKGPLICFFFILLTRYKFIHIFKPRIIIPVIIGITIVFIYFPEYINNLLSLVDEDIASEGKGSSVQGRENQFKVALRIFEMNPFTGMGINSAAYFSKQNDYFAGIMGSESVWLKILPDQGLFGVFAYFMIYKTLFDKTKDLVPLKIVTFFLLAILSFDTTNGHSIDNIIWWMCPFLTIIRYYELNKKKLI